MQEYTDILCLDWNDYYGSYKWPKLSEVVSYLNLDKKYLEDKTKEVFGLDENVDFHDARLDVVTTREIAKIYYELCDGLSFKDSYHLKFYFDNMIRLPKDSPIKGKNIKQAITNLKDEIKELTMPLSIDEIKDGLKLYH